MPQKKRKKNKSNRPKNTDIRKAIIEFFDRNPNRQYNIKQIAFRLGMQKKKEKKSLQDMLNYLSESGQIAEPVPWKYMAMPQTDNCPEGKIEITKYGYGFVSCPHLEQDIFIPPKHTGSAFNGDTVKVKLSKSKKGKKIEGHVTEVVQRYRDEFVGVLDVGDKYAFLIPDNPKIHVDFFIPLSKLNKGKDGEKAVVKFNDWPSGSKNPFAQVARVLGEAGEHNVEMHAILEEFGLPYEFSKGIQLEADAIPDQITEKEIQKRRDFRDVLTFTIDPADAKDFDDAISYKKLKNGHVEIGVHIADVTHYLKPGSDLDKEALRRATSVYLVDRVVPMLPERLSNFLCSLRPKEDKLCFSAVFEMDNKANIIKEWFGKTVIHSNRRFAYEEVQKIIEDKKGELSDEILLINKMAGILRKKRFQEGSFSFETEEVKFQLNELGHPIGVFTKIQKEANILIEEFMLLANKQVALLMSESGKEYPSVYRVHESPNKEKLEEFARLAGQFGYKIDRTDNKSLAQSFNVLLDELEGKPEQNFLQSLAIRAMSKAKYTTKNIGHYGLAFDHYTHFTSPIRRYPDVLLHRMLQDYLQKQTPGYKKELLEGHCNHSSEREINAEAAERASIKYKQVEYMQDKIGQEFKGVISGVIEGGLFIELIENKCEGFVSIQNIDNDFYIFDEANYQFTGYNSKKVFKMGQVVQVIVAQANLVKRQIDFEMVLE